MGIYKSTKQKVTTLDLSTSRQHDSGCHLLLPRTWQSWNTIYDIYNIPPMVVLPWIWHVDSADFPQTQFYCRAGLVWEPESFNCLTTDCRDTWWILVGSRNYHWWESRKFSYSYIYIYDILHVPETSMISLPSLEVCIYSKNKYLWSPQPWAQLGWLTSFWLPPVDGLFNQMAWAWTSDPSWTPSSC